MSFLRKQSIKARVLRTLTPMWRLDQQARRARLFWLIARHDIFFFQWAGLSLLEGNGEYPFIKRLGKRIVSVCVGDDVRHWSAYNEQWAQLKTRALIYETYANSIRRIR